MLQAGRSRFLFPMRSLDFFNWPNPSSRIPTLWSTQPLTEMSTRNLTGEVKGCRCLRLTPLLLSVSRLSRWCGSLDVSGLYGPSRPISGIALPYEYIIITDRICKNKEASQLNLFSKKWRMEGAANQWAPLTLALETYIAVVQCSR
jgi:hypothetical protein